MSVLLEDAGHKITSMMESKSAFETILAMKPDCVICDLMMPSVDRFQLCKMVPEQPELNNTKFIMVSENAYEFDHKHSFTFGAHGYIRKPLNTETFSVQINRILNDHIDMRFGRRRGTLPVSGETALKYAGNTSCISIEFPRQSNFLSSMAVAKLKPWAIG